MIFMLLGIYAQRLSLDWLPKTPYFRLHLYNKAAVNFSDTTSLEAWSRFCGGFKGFLWVKCFRWQYLVKYVILKNSYDLDFPTVPLAIPSSQRMPVDNMEPILRGNCATYAWQHITIIPQLLSEPVRRVRCECTCCNKRRFPAWG